MAEITNQQFQGVVEQVKDIIKFDDAKGAFNSIKIIENFLVSQQLEKSNPEFFAAYKRLIVRLKWVALIYLREEEVEDLFKNNLAETFAMEYFDLWEKFRTYLIGEVFIHTERDVFKEKIKNILNKCQTFLTSQKLENGSAPTVENWVKDYTAAVGLGSVDSVKMQNYFLTGVNIKKLSSAENERVASFFKFYEKLKLSSLTVAGVEESIPVPIDDKGTIGLIREGRIERIAPLPPDVEKILDVVEGVERKKPPLSSPIIANEAVIAGISATQEKQIAEMKQAAAKYPSGSLERKAVEEEIRKIEVRSQK
jgi:hypothetical protein